MLSDKKRLLRQQMNKLILSLIENQKEYFNPNTKDLTHYFIQSFRNTDLSICLQYSATISKFVEVLDPIITLQITNKYLNPERKHSLIYVAIMFLKALCPHLKKDDLLPYIETILDKFKELLNGSITQIRMNVAMCIGGFYSVMGDNFEIQYLKNRFGDQISLFRKYIKKN